jgi:hypothetical protein
MANAHDIQTNFTAGELSPLLNGRVDLAAYRMGCKELRNAMVMPFGGVRRRFGTRYVADCYSAASASRVIAFGNGYVIELAHYTLRVFDANGLLKTLSAPWMASQVFEIAFAQSSDTMILVHPLHAPRRLLYVGAGVLFSLDVVPIMVYPFAEVGTWGSASLTLSDANVGTGRTATASAASFLPSDVGREISAGSGSATITGYSSSTVVTVTVVRGFDSMLYGGGQWIIEGSPRTSCTPSAAGPVGASITLTSGVDGSLGSSKAVTLATWDAVTLRASFTVTSHGYSSGDSVRVAEFAPAAWNGDRTISVVDANTFTVAMSVDPLAVYGYGTVAKINTGGTVSAWRSSDVGAHVRINGGLVRITSFTSSTAVVGQVVVEMSDAIAAPADAWTLEPPAWGRWGYPATVAFHEQRLLFAGCMYAPAIVQASRSAEYFDFTSGTLDADGWQREIFCDEYEAIRHLVSDTALLALGFSNEYTVRGGIEKPITPTNIRVRPKSNHGAARLRPLKIGTERIFFQRSARQVLAMQYVEENDSYKVDDVGLLAQHFFDVGVVDAAFQRRPQPLLYCVLADGTMAVATYDRAQNVLAWTLWHTDGQYESVAAAPQSSSDAVWVVVRRWINGQFVRMIERFEWSRPEYGRDYGGQLDCAVERSASGGVVSGLSHLEQEVVQVLGGGAYLGQYTVSSGQITLVPAQSLFVLVGKSYTTRIVPMPPEMPTGAGSARGRQVRAVETTLIMHESLGATLNGLPIPELAPITVGDFLVAHTGDVRVDGLEGWERGQPLMEIEQTLPLPLHVLALSTKLVVNP